MHQPVAVKVCAALLNKLLGPAPAPLWLYSLRFTFALSSSILRSAAPSPPLPHECLQHGSPDNVR